MAAGNWATIMLRADGTPIKDYFEAKSRVTLEVYKNWLDVRDLGAWESSDPFDRHIVLRINAGDFQYRHLQVRAVRGPQEGIYCVCWDEDSGVGFVGCGVYGFTDPSDQRAATWIGFNDSCREFMRNWLAALENDDDVPDELTQVSLAKLTADKSWS